MVLYSIKTNRSNEKRDRQAVQTVTTSDGTLQKVEVKNHDFRFQSLLLVFTMQRCLLPMSLRLSAQRHLFDIVRLLLLIMSNKRKKNWTWIEYEIGRVVQWWGVCWRWRWRRRRRWWWWKWRDIAQRVMNWKWWIGTRIIVCSQSRYRSWWCCCYCCCCCIIVIVIVVKWKSLICDFDSTRIVIIVVIVVCWCWLCKRIEYWQVVMLHCIIIDARRNSTSNS